MYFTYLILVFKYLICLFKKLLKKKITEYNIAPEIKATYGKYVWDLYLFYEATLPRLNKKVLFTS